MTIKEYRELLLPGYSVLSKLTGDPRDVKKAIDGERKETRSLGLGSLVDILLTSPEEFHDNFYVLDGNVPTEAYLNLAKEYIRLKELYLIETQGNIELFDKNKTILQARSNINFQSNWKEATLLTNFEENCTEYIAKVEEADGRTLISPYDYSLGKRLTEGTKTNPFTSRYFNAEEGIEIIYQLPIVFVTKEGYELKSLPDVVYIDHNNKTIQILDIKTFGESFLKNYFKYKYYYQGAIYTFAVTSYLFNERKDLMEYSMLPFKFIAIDTSENYLPTVYQMREEDLTAATWGGTISDRKVIGWLKLTEDFYWHLNKDMWDYSREVYEKGFKIIE